MTFPKVLHLITGGTIGGSVPEYAEIEQAADLFNDTVNFEKHITRSFKAQLEYVEFVVCKKDSREINERDRNILAEAIEREYENGVNRFLITHGTYTMPDTGIFLTQKLPDEILTNSLIVLTGAMYPWNVYGSDAPLNLGASISQLITKNYNSVWLCMHGQMFKPNEVTKNVGELLFEKKSS
jgi:L-asparaginase/Glu-tRNA(Gln) amidotransferase subunit D